MKMTKVKNKKHHCPKCGIVSSKCMKITNVNVLARKIGAKFGYPHYGESIQCVKCNWNGTWYVKPNDLKKIVQAYNKAKDPYRLRKLKGSVFR